tara:strand:- start:8718 stop:8927 length:210 start_codon:yes stop_codon:yes gene_type:complete
VQSRILKPAPYGAGFKIVFGYALGFKFIVLKVSENSQQSLNFRKLGSQFILKNNNLFFEIFFLLYLPVF